MEPGIFENYGGDGDNVLLHEYCMTIDKRALSIHMNNCKQTDLTEGIEHSCAKTVADTSVQCSVEVISILVQTGLYHAFVKHAMLGFRQANRFENIQHSDEEYMF